MKEIKGNIFNILDADAICVTTNGVVKNNGELVMGAGIALQFANKFPGLADFFGRGVKEMGNHVQHAWYRLPNQNNREICIISIPTKHHWKDKSDMFLILRSIKELVQKADDLKLKKIVLSRPGCGLGGLDYETQVKPAIQHILDDRFYIITPEGK